MDKDEISEEQFYEEQNYIKEEIKYQNDFEQFMEIYYDSQEYYLHLTNVPIYKIFNFITNELSNIDDSMYIVPELCFEEPSADMYWCEQLISSAEPDIFVNIYHIHKLYKFIQKFKIKKMRI